MGVTMQQHGAEEGRVGGWYLFPPPPDYVDELKKQEKFLLISDAGGTNSESFSVNVMGMAIGLIILLFFVQLAMPGIRQVGDFIGDLQPLPPLRRGRGQQIRHLLRRLRRGQQETLAP